jgi:acetyl-CoA carboxylase biotin carboxyl carrier protein
MTREPDTEGLVALIDRLEVLLNASELSEIEIEAGETALVVRKPVDLPVGGSSGGQPGESAASAAPVGQPPAGDAQEREGAAEARAKAVVAPLTGLYYGSPSPGAEPYVREGGQVVVGQVIGLIEAMKLFNEIKSDLAGRVARICVVNGALVKARQPLIEVEP